MDRNVTRCPRSHRWLLPQSRPMSLTVACWSCAQQAFTLHVNRSKWLDNGPSFLSDYQARRSRWSEWNSRLCWLLKAISSKRPMDCTREGAIIGQINRRSSHWQTTISEHESTFTLGCRAKWLLHSQSKMCLNRAWAIRASVQEGSKQGDL